jgi:N-acetylneuraminate synthase
MSGRFSIGGRELSLGFPVYLVGEIGVNHNGSIEIAKELIDAAALAGLDAVKFQKRTPDLCVPRSQWFIKRATPWGEMNYIDYRHKVEFDHSQYQEIANYCTAKKMHWFASAWDEQAVDFLEEFGVCCHKIASAGLPDEALLKRVASTGRPVILSTGMSTMNQIHRAVDVLNSTQLLLCHTTSAYPTKPHELNLKMIGTLAEEFKLPVGYSGHELGILPSLASVPLGACLVERHITLDRTMWGSDQSVSLEPVEFSELAKGIRLIESSLGDGIKQVYDSELGVMNKLRRDKR